MYDICRSSWIGLYKPVSSYYLYISLNGKLGHCLLLYTCIICIIYYNELYICKKTFQNINSYFRDKMMHSKYLHFYADVNIHAIILKFLFQQYDLGSF